MKVGAQKCVIQRVRKIAVVVRERSSGENDWAEEFAPQNVYGLNAGCDRACAFLLCDGDH
jgi:hypothetical protein